MRRWLLGALVLSPVVLLLLWRRRRTSSNTEEEITEDDFNADAEHAARVLARAQNTTLRLVKDRNPALSWHPFVEDVARRSFAYVLRREDNPSFTPQQLQQWFQQLHPDALGLLALPSCTL